MFKLIVPTLIIIVLIAIMAYLTEKLKNSPERFWELKFRFLLLLWSPLFLILKLCNINFFNNMFENLNSQKIIEIIMFSILSLSFVFYLLSNIHPIG